MQTCLLRLDAHPTRGCSDVMYVIYGGSTIMWIYAWWLAERALIRGHCAKDHLWAGAPHIRGFLRMCGRSELYDRWTTEPV